MTNLIPHHFKTKALYFKAKAMGYKIFYGHYENTQDLIRRVLEANNPADAHYFTQMAVNTVIRNLVNDEKLEITVKVKGE